MNESAEKELQKLLVQVEKVKDLIKKIEATFPEVPKQEALGACEMKPGSGPSGRNVRVALVAREADAAKCDKGAGTKNMSDGADTKANYMITKSVYTVEVEFNK